MLKPLDSTFEIIPAPCKICQLNPPDFSIPLCHHNFCESCVKTYLSISITEGQVLHLTCPEQGCSQAISQSLVASLIPELSQKFQRFQQNKQKELDPNFRWCPKVDCSGFGTKDNSNSLECSKCKFNFCFKCSEAWHDGRCKDSVMLVNKQIKKCPKCQVLIEKKTGCPQMKCLVCAYKFCWLCSQGLENHSIKKCFLHSNTGFYWVLGLILMFFPLILFFWLPMMLFLFIYIENGREEYAKKRKLFLIGFYIGFSLAPILFIFGMLVILLYFPYEAAKGQYPKRPCKLYKKILICCLLLPYIYLTCFIGILTTFSILLVVCPLLGLTLLLFRLFLLFFTHSN